VNRRKVERRGGGRVMPFLDQRHPENKTFVFSVAGAALFITIMFFYGIVALTILRPERNAEIAELTDARDHWQARAKELDKYIGIQNKNIATQEDKYRVACKFDHLFMMIADPDQVISFEALDGYIKTRKAFFEPVKVNENN